MIEQGKTYGLVGESGSGKSTTGKSNYWFRKITNGEIIYQGQDVTSREVEKRLDTTKMSNDFPRFVISLNPKNEY